MSEYANLRDEQIFPTFKLCPDENDITSDFYDPTDDIFRPKRHWCLLAEITEVENIIRMRLVTKDKSGVEFPIAFYLDEDGAKLNWSRFRVGRTVAILYPRQHGFLDRTVGIRQEEASCVKVLGTSLADLLAVSDRVQAQATKVGERRACHACEKQPDSLLQCARCQLFWYCDKKCQEVGWQEKGHKNDCRVLKDKDLQGLFALKWDCFEDVLQFPLQSA